MQEEDISSSDSDSVLGRVRDIRRKWAVQEDEALAYRLQDEEIAQHYNSNRTRNAIVREDAPRAREAQRQEELQALEERLNHLSLLNKQAEEDARLAKLLASRDSEGAKVRKHHQQVSPNGNHRVEKPQLSPLSPSLSPNHIQQHVTSDVFIQALKPMKSPLLGAAAAPMPPVKLEVEPGPSRGILKMRKLEYEEEDEDDLRRMQEERDAAVARALQEEMNKEKDKQLALEAQDRELAKMLHEKERARYRRAKEKARMKAEAMAQMERETTPEGEAIRAASRNSSSSERSRSVLSGEVGLALPPKIPEKQKSPVGDHLGFRANPKPLPPNPLPGQEYPPHRLDHHLRPDPVPPYMPIHGYNSPKRNK